MSDFSVMLNLMLMMMLMVAIGLLARRVGIITPDMQKGLTDLLLKVIVPCNIVDAFVSVGGDALTSSGFVQLVVISAAIHAVSLLMGLYIYPRVKDSRRPVLRFATLFSNANYFGLPVITGIYGMRGVLYLAIAMIPLRMLLWSYGLHLYGGDGGETRLWRGLLKSLTHPCIFSVFIGVALFALDVRLPVFLGDTVSRVGACVTPVSLMIVGSIMAGIALRDLIDRYVLYLSAVRLLVIPLLTLGILKLLSVEPLITGVCVLMAAMPAASVTAALADRYGANAEFGAKCVVFSTLLSMLTLPAIRMLL